MKKHHHHHHEEISVVELLKSHKLSVTVPRKAILELMINEDGPFSAEDILFRLDNLCDLATIYRCLKQFEESEIIIPVYLKKESVQYEYNNKHHHHHHIICKSCNKIEIFEDCFIEKIESQIKKKGYKQITHRLEFFAICEKCSA